MKSCACSTDMLALVENSLDAAAAEILEHYQINATCGLYRRWRPLEEVLHTYLIESWDTDCSTWRNAAVEINGLFLAAGVAQRDIEVEIVNHSLSNHRTSTALPNDPAILDALEGTNDKVVDFLEEHAPSHWTSVAFHMRHNKFRPQEPMKPTILVFFRIGACANFGYLERELRALLKHELTSLLAIEFLSGQVDS